jgi:hypothetical protein
MTEEQMRDLVKECGLDWHRGYMPLFDDDQTNRYAVLIEAAVAAERERAARVCDDEARIRTEAGNTHPENSDSRGRCFAAARAAINCAKGVRGGEVVGPSAEVTGLGRNRSNDER